MSHCEDAKEEIRDHHIIRHYKKFQRRYKIYLSLAILASLAVSLASLFLGSYGLSPGKVLLALLGQSNDSSGVVVLTLRLPRILASLVSGLGLAISGAVMQSALRNPLASPFTLGISNGAAFGAALAIILTADSGQNPIALHSSATPLVTFNNIYLVSGFALAGSMLTMGAVLLLAGLRNMKSDAVILAGIALSSLFASGTVLLQYLADEVQLAAIVFWSFGDVSRSSGNELGLVAAGVGMGAFYFYILRWKLNALLESDETSMSLGIHPARTRMFLMLAASLVTSFIVAFHGVIAFLGLLAPHIARRFVGDDTRYLIPLSGAIGMGLLIVSDTLGRILVPSGTLPVGVITSFMGAPLFILLLTRGRR